MDLLEGLVQTKDAERGSVLTELLMFYGQAFENVREVVSREVVSREVVTQEVVTQEAGPALVFTKILHECIMGTAVYRVWRDSRTPLLARAEYQRMEKRWQRIRQMAGTEK